VVSSSKAFTNLVAWNLPIGARDAGQRAGWRRRCRCRRRRAVPGAALPAADRSRRAVPGRRPEPSLPGSSSSSPRRPSRATRSRRARATGDPVRPVDGKRPAGRWSPTIRSPRRRGGPSARSSPAIGPVATGRAASDPVSSARAISCGDRHRPDHIRATFSAREGHDLRDRCTPVSACPTRARSGLGHHVPAAPAERVLRSLAPGAPRRVGSRRSARA
jgi:hypothetical protein